MLPPRRQYSSPSTRDSRRAIAGRGPFNVEQDDFFGHGAMTFSKMFEGEFGDPARVWITGTRFAGDDEANTWTGSTMDRPGMGLCGNQ